MSVKPALRSRSSGNTRFASLLNADEVLVRSARISGGIFWKGIALLIASILLTLLVPVIFNLGVFLIFVSLIVLLVEFLTKHYLLLIVTDKRVLVRYGILTLEVVQMRLSKIESVELEWTPMGRILGYSIVILTGTGSRISAIPFIADGPAFRKDLDAMLLAMEDKPIAVVPASQPYAPAPMIEPGAIGSAGVDPGPIV